MSNIQYNAAVKYLEKNQYKLSLQNSRAIAWFLGIASLIVFFYFIKFVVALP